MLIGTIIYTFAELLVQGLFQAIIAIAGKILDDSITVFTSDQNIFETFINFIPFAENIHLPSIIRSISYGLVILMLVINLLKSVASPMTGDSTISPAQACVRAALSITLIIAFFGVGFGTTDTFTFDGIISLIGRWFGSILSAIGMEDFNSGLANMKLVNPFSDAFEYIGAILLFLAMLTSVLGAALQYVERIISYALYVVLGPIAIAMYTNKETAQTFKDWMVGLFSQFIAILLSLVMWICFIHSINTSDGSVFSYAVSIAILGLMRNSEKILNAMGLRATTMSLGDSARSIGGALNTVFGAVGATVGLSKSLHNYVSNKNHVVAGQSINASATSHGFDSAGTWMGDKGYIKNDNSQILSGLTSGRFITNTSNAIKRSNEQHNAVNSINTALQNNESINAQTLNTAFGFDNNTGIRVVGSGEGGMLQPAMVKNADGQDVKGFTGDVVYEHGGQIDTVNAFIPTSTPGLIDAGTAITNLNGEGVNQIIADKGFSLGNTSAYIFRIDSEANSPSFNEIDNGGTLPTGGLNLDKPKVVSETVYEAKNQ